MDWAAFSDWLDHLSQLGGQYQFTDADIANLGLMMNYESANQQQQQNDLASRQNDYNNRQLDFQEAQLPYQYDQLGYQQDQLDFQRGPQMDFNRQQLADQTTMSHNDVLKSANYLQQQRYGTDAAKYQADVARYQAMAQLGMVAPQGLSLADPMFAAVNQARHTIPGRPVDRFSALGY